jgi:hypothetical protein
MVTELTHTSRPSYPGQAGSAGTIQHDISVHGLDLHLYSSCHAQQQPGHMEKPSSQLVLMSTGTWSARVHAHLPWPIIVDSPRGRGDLEQFPGTHPHTL